MLVTVQTSDSVTTASLPDEMYGAYWLTDAHGDQIIFAEAEGDQWSLSPLEGVDLVGVAPDQRILVPRNAHSVFSAKGLYSEWTVTCRPSMRDDKVTRIIGLAQDVELRIGRAADNTIRHPSQFVSAHHATIVYSHGDFSVIDHGSANGVFVNGIRIESNTAKRLRYGDVVFIVGLHITFGDRFISLNCPEGALIIEDAPSFVAYRSPCLVEDKRPARSARKLFYPALRFAHFVKRKQFTIDPPPQQTVEEDVPIGMRIGPSLVMGCASLLSAGISITLWAGQGSGGMLRAVPLVVMALAMLMGSVLWPVLNTRFQRKRQAVKEIQRKNAYAQYLGRVRAKLQHEAALQRSILEENHISSQQCITIALRRDARFMARTPLHQDYLDIRFGRGDIDLDVDIHVPERCFDVEEDALREAVDAFVREPKRIDDAPCVHSLFNRPFIGIVGDRDFTDGFIRNILIQLCALHSYSQVKIVIMISAKRATSFDFARYVPHLFSDSKDVRFLAEGFSEMSMLDMVLKKMLKERLSHDRRSVREERPYVILICPDKEIYDRSQIVRDVLDLHENTGFALIACAQDMHELPTKCHTVIGQMEQRAYLLERDDPIGKKRVFTPDPFVSLPEAHACMRAIARTRLDLSWADESSLNGCTFLQLYGVKQVPHLNVAKRWRESNASIALGVPVGMDATGNPLILDIHEDFHGPHGLIAGTTGSGKSEFIITYILSLAVSFPPDEVAFVLIDYKGGGLARAFDNDRYVLPHIAGTITNLDGSAIARSLSSIKSELRRRQRLFNEARELVGGDTVDISNYLDLYRQGKVDDPCPHLILVADEFAELKQQEPAFMEELISASRIGRSLGVHLILATQKPCGVVNDQIWSNARFKIAFKVADAADSTEVIKCADAAHITRPGQFCLLVGYNESFTRGQSGYAGAPYLPGQSDRPRDRKVSCVSNTGRIVLSVEPELTSNERHAQTQLVSIAEHLVRTATDLGKQARPLWLPALPAHLELKEVEARYEWEAPEECVFEPIIGIYDHPTEQKQGLLTLPLSSDGNAVVYGGSESGVEQLLRTALFSVLQSHSPCALHCYLLDFGSRSLCAFAQAPHVGDVVTESEDEKVRRFFEFIRNAIMERRVLFSVHGGSYDRHRAQGGTSPALLIAINGIGAFLEAYPQYEEALIDLARDSSQVGIFLIVTAETPHAVRMRMRSFFRQIVACNLTDPADYVMLFGSLRDTALPHGFGRGLVRKGDQLLEFQVACLCAENASEYACIEKACLKWGKRFSRETAAPPLPQAPDGVLPLELAELSVRAGQVPFGVFDDTLMPAVFDMEESSVFRCVCLKPKMGSSFAETFVAACAQRNGINVALLDMAHLLRAQPKGCSATIRSDERASSYLMHLVTEGIEKKTLLFITGIMGFLARCPSDVARHVEGFIKELRPVDLVSVVLFDIAAEAPLAHEGWLRVHLSTRDGLWVGPGINGQSAINTSYDKHLLPDAKMTERMGYAVEGGVARLVHIAGKRGRDRNDRTT